MFVLGVRVDEVNETKAIERARGFLSAAGQYTVFTPNPEMLAAAQSDEYFRRVLNAGSLNLCDGRGIEMISRGMLKCLPGIDFMLKFCELAEEEGVSVYILGSGDYSVAQKAGGALRAKFPTLTVAGVDPGSKIELEKRADGVYLRYDATENETLIAKINAARPGILFVGFGHGKQEKWIAENLRRIQSVKIAMGVGGAIDILGGKLKRAPCWMRRLWLEWLWRLLQEPRRVKRIWNATVKFLHLYCTQQKPHG